jgi:predicted transcriptional regulator
VKEILCVKIDNHIKDFLRKVANDNDRSVSYVVQKTLDDYKKYYERVKTNENTK